MTIRPLAFAVVLVAAGLGGAAHRSAFDPQDAVELWRYSRTSYCDVAEIRARSCKTCGTLARRRGLEDVETFSSSKYKSQGFAAIDRSGSAPRVILAFRGGSNLRNLLSALSVWQTDFPLCSRVRMPWVGRCRVLSGFHGMWESLRREGVVSSVAAMVTRLAAEARRAGHQPRVSVVVVGHSMGGALANFAAVTLQHTLPPADARVSLYTYGAPRVGNADFARFVAQSLEPGVRMFRITLGADPVPATPPEWSVFWSYRHPPHEVFYESRQFNARSFVDCDDFQSHGTMPWTGGGGGPRQDKRCHARYWLPLNILDHLNYMGMNWLCAEDTRPVLQAQRK